MREEDCPRPFQGVGTQQTWPFPDPRGAEVPEEEMLDPIEEAFSKIKQLLVRKAGPRVREALVETIGRALASVRLEDAAGWFAHAGYRPQDQDL